MFYSFIHCPLTNIARVKQIPLYNSFFFKWITGITDKKCKNLNSRSGGIFLCRFFSLAKICAFRLVARAVFQGRVFLWLIRVMKSGREVSSLMSRIRGMSFPTGFASAKKVLIPGERGKSSTPGRVFPVK